MAITANMDTSESLQNSDAPPTSTPPTVFAVEEKSEGETPSIPVATAVPLFKLRTSTDALNIIISKVQKKAEKARKAADKKKLPTPAEKAVSPAKKSQKRNPKRTEDSDGFQLPPKHLTIKEGKRNNLITSLPVQIYPPTSPSIGDEDSINSEDEDAGEPVPPPTSTKTKIPPFFITLKGD
ncbi:hypothetical protein NPIL_116581 [Nephila pilipes]|uniref:Uncharacterized protein n=1 Tax=Nephila pilipes TaxID=299642 RepID=A0A8X6NFI1_NEPPI|nr:hypothetical protein NPIL_116581 [Nephila pilipes]